MRNVRDINRDFYVTSDFYYGKLYSQCVLDQCIIDIMHVTLSKPIENSNTDIKNTIKLEVKVFTLMERSCRGASYAIFRFKIEPVVLKDG